MLRARPGSCSNQNRPRCRRTSSPCSCVGGEEMKRVALFLLAARRLPRRPTRQPADAVARARRQRRDARQARRSRAATLLSARRGARWVPRSCVRPRRRRVPAGTYHFVLDAVIIAPVDVTFDLIWRRGTTDTPLATWTQHFDPLAGGSFDAQPFEVDMDCAGDRLRRPAISSCSATPARTRRRRRRTSRTATASHANGRIPNITLP